MNRKNTSWRHNNLLKESSNTLHIVFPSKLSYDELDNIKDIFDVIYDVIREYNK